MNDRESLRVILILALLTTSVAATSILLQIQSVEAKKQGFAVPGPEMIPIVISNHNVYVSWNSNKTGNYEAMFRASENNGQTFSDKVNISNSPNGTSGQPDLAVFGRNVYVTWQDNKTGNAETFIRTSTDNGRTFGDAIILNSTGTSPVLINSYPELIGGSVVAASGNNTYVTWWDNKTGNWEVFLARSTDNGRTFDKTVNLSNSSESRSDRALIAAEGKNVYVSYWERNGPNNEPVMRVSNDNGATFVPALKLAAKGIIGITG
jgi:hypothetical protein